MSIKVGHIYGGCARSMYIKVPGFLPSTATDLSILDALCGIDGDEPNDEGLSEDDDDDSYDAQG